MTAYLQLAVYVMSAIFQGLLAYESRGNWKRMAICGFAVAVFVFLAVKQALEL